VSAYSPIGVGFIHIPKTGGKSMKTWIKENTLQAISYEQAEHYSASMLLEKHPKIDYFFTIVRNPWSRMVSWYRYLIQKYVESGQLDKAVSRIDFNSNDTITASEFKNNFQNISFEKFVNEYTDLKTKAWFKFSTPQIKWLDRPIDLVIKLENINEQFKEIQKIFNCSKELPHLNKHGNKNQDHYTLFYNDNTMKKIGKIFEEDIETFKYRFEE
jgi:hypothetical protein